MISIDLTGLRGFVTDDELSTAIQGAAEAQAQISKLPMHGWTTLPAQITPELGRIAAAGARISEQSETLVVVGVGGSSLGARALVDAFPTRKGVREVLYIGDSFSGGAMARLLKSLQTREFSVLVTSKSGTTTETAIALRFLLRALNDRYGNALRQRLFVVTGDHASPLRTFAEQKQCELFTIPENIGGRYSVLTAGGLLPAAARGLSITALVRGAATEANSHHEVSIKYAAARQLLHKKGYTTELLASFEPELRSFGEWWTQLFGESECKLGRGIFPVGVTYSADLHSLGQCVQEGRRDLFETTLAFSTLPLDVQIPRNRDFDDGFRRLDEHSLNDINTIVRQSVHEAHISGGVPSIELSATTFNEERLGAMLYFFEYACAVSACIDGVNPFDQPGVEAYKSLMRAKLKDL